jgi:3-oxoacyl-[acyl-carrier protein] reductase
MSSATLVVGASSEIGRALLRQLPLAADESVLAHHHSGAEVLRALASETPDRDVRLLAADLTTPAGAEALARQVLDTGTKVLRLVHLPAPKLHYTRFKDLSAEAFEREYTVQVRSITVLLQAVLPAMVAARKGRVVFVLSSVVYGKPPAALCHYVVAKYALLGMLRALAAEYADRGITFNAVSPSMLRTPLVAELPEKLLEIAAERNPMKRLATPGEVAAAIVRFLSDDAGFTTGCNWPVTGGESF